MDSELKRFEEELERLSPGSLPEGLIARMELAMESWEQVPDKVSEEVVEGIDKVVPFPRREKEEEGARTGSSIWAAAASVAFLGALAGLLITVDSDQANVVATASIAAGESARVQPVEFAPQAAQRKILGASDDSVVIANGAQPLRVMRLDYVDRLVFRNAQGEEVHVEVPAVNYRLIPLVTD